MAAEKTNDSILIPIKEIKSKVEFDNFAQEQRFINGTIYVFEQILIN